MVWTDKTGSPSHSGEPSNRSYFPVIRPGRGGGRIRADSDLILGFVVGLRTPFKPDLGQATVRRHSVRIAKFYFMSSQIRPFLQTRHCEESRLGGTTKQSSWMATARSARLAMTDGLKTRPCLVFLAIRLLVWLTRLWVAAFRPLVLTSRRPIRTLRWLVMLGGRLVLPVGCLVAVSRRHISPVRCLVSSVQLLVLWGRRLISNARWLVLESRRLVFLFGGLVFLAGWLVLGVSGLVFSTADSILGGADSF